MSWRLQINPLMCDDQLLPIAACLLAVCLYARILLAFSDSLLHCFNATVTLEPMELVCMASRGNTALVKREEISVTSDHISTEHIEDTEEHRNP